MNLAVMQDVMLAIAGNESVGEVLRRIVDGISHCPNVALARIWLIRSEVDAAGERTWLQLAASGGNPRTIGADPHRLDGRFARFELGERKIGQVAATGQGMLLGDLARAEPWIADPDWARGEELVAFAAQPLIARGRTLGVLAVFDRATIAEADFRWLRTFADHAAVAIASARAYEEIDRLRERLELENEYLRSEVAAGFGDILGQSAALQKALRQIELVAPTHASVLLQGESGVGKELVARAIHERSARRQRPLIKVNCGSIPGELFESEFFGHVKGAFTGALRDRAGRFALASGGTLFLDEVGEIPLQHQVKLLRVLQEGTFERVGDERTHTADVRVIAATNKDLSAEAAAGRFRSDLYYRLSVFPIDVPPLRERREDIPLLAAHFAESSAKSLGVRAARLTRSDVERLQAYAWPGNVRELQHVIQRAVILARGGPLDFQSLAAASGVAPHPSSRPRAAESQAAAPPLPTLAALREQERGVIAAALERAGGRVSGRGGAAELLGVPPTTLDSKLRVLGLKPRRQVR